MPRDQGQPGWSAIDSPRPRPKPGGGPNGNPAQAGHKRAPADKRRAQADNTQPEAEADNTPPEEAAADSSQAGGGGLLAMALPTIAPAERPPIIPAPTAQPKHYAFQSPGRPMWQRQCPLLRQAQPTICACVHLVRRPGADPESKSGSPRKPPDSLAASVTLRVRLFGGSLVLTSCHCEIKASPRTGEPFSP